MLLLSAVLALIAAPAEAQDVVILEAISPTGPGNTVTFVSGPVNFTPPTGSGITVTASSGPVNFTPPTGSGNTVTLVSGPVNFAPPTIPSNVNGGTTGTVTFSAGPTAYNTPALYPGINTASVGPSAYTPPANYGNLNVGSVNFTASVFSTGSGVINLNTISGSPPRSIGTGSNISIGPNVPNIGNVTSPHVPITQPILPATLPSLPTTKTIPNVVTPSEMQEALNVVRSNGVPTDRISWKFASPAQTAALKPSTRRVILTAKISTVDEQNCSVWHDGTAVFQLNSDGALEFSSGTMVITAHKPIKIMHGGNIISLDAGSIVQIAAGNGLLLVRALHDEHRDGINVSVGKDTFDVAVGSEVCLGKDEKSIRSAIADGLMRRQLVFAVLSNGEHMATSCFSLPHLLSQSDIFALMYRGSASDRVAVEKLLKMAAALHYASSHRGPYKALN